MYPFHVTGGEDGEARERDEIRHDRRRDRQHDRNISRAAPDKRCWTCVLNTVHVNSSAPRFAALTFTHAQMLNHSWNQQNKARQDAANCSEITLLCLLWSPGNICVCVHAEQKVVNWVGLWRSWKSEGGLIKITIQAVKLCYLEINFHLVLTLQLAEGQSPTFSKDLYLQMRMCS